jgi:hypothetical protein
LRFFTFTQFGEAFNTCNNIALAVVAHTASKPVSKRHLVRRSIDAVVMQIRARNCGGVQQGRKRMQRAADPDDLTLRR